MTYKRIMNMKVKKEHIAITIIVVVLGFWMKIVNNFNEEVGDGSVTLFDSFKGGIENLFGLITSNTILGNIFVGIVILILGKAIWRFVKNKRKTI
jgi:hypothetical protein